MVYMLFGRIHRLCSPEHNFHFFSRDYYTDVSAVDLYFYAWVVSKCRVMYCIGYHVRFSLIIVFVSNFCGFYNSFRSVVLF